MEAVKQLIKDYPLIVSVIRYILIVVFILLCIQLLRKFLKKRIENTYASR